MAYKAKVVLDSVSYRYSKHRLTTFEITFPRIVLAEVVTHRNNSDSWGFEIAERSTTADISKNSASSRAIPIERMIKAVQDDPYIPERFSKAGKGMQGDGWLEGDDHEMAVEAWLRARDQAIVSAGVLLSIGAHKQEANRLLEPWAWVTQIVTATEWPNFFALRCHKAAAPAFQKIARLMYLRMRESEPRGLENNQWHLPMVDEKISDNFRFQIPAAMLDAGSFQISDIPEEIQFSAARCAWVSYENHARESTPEAMKATFARLFAEVPVHASPIEHQATPMPGWLPYDYRRSNLNGWFQARKLVANEKLMEFNPSDEEVASWGLT